jgi:hypothetical protein
MEIPGPPSSISTEPDAYTAAAPDFSSEDRANHRVLHITTRFLKYGTDDKAHAAALILSGVLLVTAILVSIIGLISLFSSKDAKWIEVLLTWIGNAFLFTAGVAVGQSGSQKNKSG